MNETDSSSSWLTGMQAAQLLGVSASRVRQLRLGDELPGQLTPCGYVYQHADVSRLLASRVRPPDDGARQVGSREMVSRWPLQRTAEP